jgi:primosomal protein N' (replication factor Y)
MICHHCSLKFQIPKSCEHCGHTALLPIGLGTQRAEENAKQLFADTPVYRIDRDTTRSNRQLNEQLQQINRGDPCVLVGTQMLAKGHHFPKCNSRGRSQRRCRSVKPLISERQNEPHS